MHQFFTVLFFFYFFQCGTDEWTGRDCLGKCCFVPVPFVLLQTCGYTVSVCVCVKSLKTHYEEVKHKKYTLDVRRKLL